MIERGQGNVVKEGPRLQDVSGGGSKPVLKPVEKPVK
jgi:hypothetical protein